ncbi:MAG TPA: flagellar biosynthesis protein FlhB [Caulobacteraceae bacterium]
MADDTDQSNKTEEPTGRRLDEARKNGDIAKSADLASWASLAGVAGTIAIAGGWVCRDLAGSLLPFLQSPDAFQLDGGGAVDVFRRALTAAAPAMIVVLGAGMISGVAGNVIQQGFIWSTGRMKPDLSKLSPAEGFKRLFGIDGLVHFLRSVLKIVIVAWVAYASLKPHAADLQGLAGMEPASVLPFAAQLIRSLAISVLVFLGGGAVIDWIWQRQRFMQRMRMSREELKEEVRQSEGDPHVKAKLRQIRNERARRRMIQQVPKATVVIVNPTHYAVALRYQQGVTEAPVCLAKGIDRVALRIREVAEDAKVPVIEDPPLARALYAAVEIDEAIPVGHYQAVAKIIGFVLNQAKRRQAPPRPMSRL